jgi:hypothetical protein|tara:strand:- start:531 stop:887 length:357 start_codon:yes stop_codon:yes gene_type:complete
MATGLKRLPVGNFGTVRAPVALPKKTLPNPRSISLPTQPQGTPAPATAKGAGKSGKGSGDRLDMNFQGISYWKIDILSSGVGSFDVGQMLVGEASNEAGLGISTWRIFSSIPHKWQGE